MKTLLILLLVVLTAGSCEFPETETPTPPETPPVEEPLISNLYDEIRYNGRTDLNLIRSTASLPSVPPDSIHITYDCLEKTIKRKTTATYIFSYEVQVPCKSDLEITYTFYFPNKDTTIVHHYPGFLF